MTYSESIEYIYSFRKMQKSSGHERIDRLLDLFGNPHKQLKFIHVAGTNGKGSVSGALGSIFTCAGYTTGLFTSPFVIEFGERIQVNGEYIDRESLCDIVSEIKEKVEMSPEEMKPTVFEFITVLAFIYFKRKNCDIVILEAGIGGGHDSTNVITCSLAQVFTCVSLDHTEMLGNTVKEISTEKSGIIKENSVVISYPYDEENRYFNSQHKDAYDVFTKKAQEKNCLFRSPDIKDLAVKEQSLEGTVFIYRNLNLKTSLWGDHQIANMMTVAECALTLKESGERITDEDIEKGIAQFTVPCRMEKVRERPVVILDGGHNEGCMLALRSMAEKYLEGKKITLLMASMKDKDYKKSLEIILPLCENAVFTCTDKIRGETGERLKKEAEKFIGNAYSYENAQEAFEKAMSLAEEDGALICCGSFYLVSDVRKILLAD